ncbi:MAG: methyltransferase domain-containing protein [Zoogloeaceae bacterium]|jgi:tRNA (guanine-N7-)-methyltransferase|nr:methyltransferase domain-containing protein [Zoogloeaceae bacterium]
MFANSHPVISRQNAPHPDLRAVLARHQANVFQKPVAACNHAAVLQALARWRAFAPDAPLVLDAGCGVGWSTVFLARQYPTCFVLGIDQSAHRLARDKSRLGVMPENLAFLRADLVDFWRELAEAGIRLHRHCLLYPNPWPKPAHLRRRWHAHPVFPTLLRLGGVLIGRSNWRPYIEEMALCLRWSGYAPMVEAYAPEGAAILTPFERKYHASGQTLWSLRCDLKEDGSAP